MCATATTADKAVMDATAGPRVLHFVSGGFSGATQVAIELCQAARRRGGPPAWLVLRSKRHTPWGRVEALRDEGLEVHTVPGWSSLATILALRRICLSLRPDILVAHGFSEHLWGRYAGLAARVPNLVMVEHNSRERYSPLRLAQARWLAGRTGRIVACSQGVHERLIELGMPAGRTTVICNGVDTERFADAASRPFEARAPGLVMTARFAKQKDHATLLRAVALLRDRDLEPPVLLVGAGHEKHRRDAEQLAHALGIGNQVRFLGTRPDVPELLMQHQVAVLSTHWEGLPLALIEAMAAGCAVVGTRVPGVQELIDDGIDGRLVAPGDAAGLADAIADLLADPAHAAVMAGRARQKALERYSIERMISQYESLYAELAAAHAAVTR